jgi:YfiH family protein
VSRIAALPRVSAPFAWRADDGLTWLTAELDTGHAAFSTRLGGVSEGPYESLNLGILTDDVRERVLANRVALAQALGREAGSIAMGRQVHGAEVQVRDHLTAGAALAEVDAQVTTSSAVTPLVLVADCVPLVLAAAGAVAAVHCGWRGVAGGIVPRAVDAVRAHGHGRISAAVGPGIGPCCYDVGPEVVERFAERGHVQQGPRLDLPTCVAVELERAGVEDVAVAGVCVSCNAELFFSHRRDGGVTGRQAGLAWLAS